MVNFSCIHSPPQKGSYWTPHKTESSYSYSQQNAFQKCISRLHKQCYIILNKKRFSKLTYFRKRNTLYTAKAVVLWFCSLLMRSVCCLLHYLKVRMLYAQTVPTDPTTDRRKNVNITHTQLNKWKNNKNSKKIKKPNRNVYVSTYGIRLKKARGQGPKVVISALRRRFLLEEKSKARINVKRKLSHVRGKRKWRLWLSCVFCNFVFLINTLFLYENCSNLEDRPSSSSTIW